MEHYELESEDTVKNQELETEMEKSLAEVRKMELFLTMAEGERNERIAKRQL